MGTGEGLVPVHRGTLILPGPYEATDRTWTKDRHKTPTSIPPFPLSVPTGWGKRFLQFSHSVVKVHEKT